MKGNSRNIVFGVVATLVLLLVLRLTLFAPQPNDQALIAQALADSIQASKEGRPGVVLDKLSDRFKVNNASVGSRFDIAKFIRDSKPEITVANRTAVVSGDIAKINSPVQVNINFLNQKFDINAENVTFVFAREDSRTWLIFPTREWKLTDVLVPEDAIPKNYPAATESWGSMWGM